MKSFLIVVDMQNDFIDGSLGTKEAVAIVPRVIQKIREFNGTILFTRDTHFGNYMETQEGKNLPVSHCIQNTQGWEIRAELLEVAKEHGNYDIVDKITFGSTGLPQIIQNLSGGEEFDIELIGLCTDICVVSNAMILKAYFPEVSISVDASCCAGVTPKAHKAALDTMKSCQIIVKEPALKLDMEEMRHKCVAWIRDFFAKNGPDCNAIVGLSGGKDSSVVAALCVEALGKDRVIGVLMPCGTQHDIDMARLLVSHLGIKNYEINIKDVIDAYHHILPFDASVQTLTNIPPRARMTLLYAVAQSHNGRVANTCNLSEDWVGYSTRYGDSVGDFSPCSNFTVQEMKELGKILGLPQVLVDKTPIDGLCGKTDEENLGFTYAVLDRYIRTGEIDDAETKALIDKKHVQNLFKLELMPIFHPYE